MSFIPLIFGVGYVKAPKQRWLGEAWVYIPNAPTSSARSRNHYTLKRQPLNLLNPYTSINLLNL